MSVHIKQASHLGKSLNSMVTVTKFCEPLDLHSAVMTSVHLPSLYRIWSQPLVVNWHVMGLGCMLQKAGCSSSRKEEDNAEEYECVKALPEQNLLKPLPSNPRSHSPSDKLVCHVPDGAWLVAPLHCLLSSHSSCATAPFAPHGCHLQHSVHFCHAEQEHPEFCIMKESVSLRTQHAALQHVPSTVFDVQKS